MADLLRRIFCFRTESGTQSVFIHDELDVPNRSETEKLSGPKLVAQLRADLNRAFDEKETLERRCIQKNKEIEELRKMQLTCDIDSKIHEGKLCVTATVKTPRSIEKTIISKVGVKLDMASVEPLISWVSVPCCLHCQRPYGGTNSANPPVVMLCGHTLCQKCAKNLESEYKELTKTVNLLKCPSCSCQQQITARDQLPKNFTLLQVVDQMNPVAVTDL